MKSTTWMALLAVPLLGASLACGGSGSGGPVILTVTAPANGTISLDPAGGRYPRGTVVTVTAAAAHGYRFTAWTGALSGATSPATVTMDADRTVGAAFVDVCTEAVNTAEAARLLAIQPVFGVRSKRSINAATTFPSVAGDAAVACPITLSFKDSSGDGALEAYEDWRLGPAVRAADLLLRMTAPQKLALLAMPALGDVPAGAGTLSTGTAAQVAAGIRAGVTAADTASPTARALWSNALQEACEASALGVPFLLASGPAHGGAPGVPLARGFLPLPAELGLAASGDPDLVGRAGAMVADDLRRVGVRLLLDGPGDLFTDPRWPGGERTFGEGSARTSALLAAWVRGVQGGTLGAGGVAAVVGHFPGAGATETGFDARLAKGKFTAYPGGQLDEHLAPFQEAVGAGVAGMMTGYAIPKAGAWTAAGGAIDGSTLEQVGASFHQALVTGHLRGRMGFAGLVVAPPGVVEEAGTAPLGAPWGVESLTRPQRIGKAVAAGVDLFQGLGDLDTLAAAGLPAAQVDAAAGRVLTLLFTLGLFEDPYVGPAAGEDFRTSEKWLVSNQALDAALVLLRNVAKPIAWLNGGGDGTQVGDPFNAGNGTGRVLPGPPGNPFLLYCNAFFVAGRFDLASVRSVSVGYGSLSNGELTVHDVSRGVDVPVATDEERIAASDYVLVRLRAPRRVDPESGLLALPDEALSYAAAGDEAELAPLAFARAAIDAHPGSRCQIIAIVEGGRPPPLAELLAHGLSGLYLSWGATDKAVLDVLYGISDGTGRLPVGLPASDAAAAAQLGDLGGDGQDAAFPAGAGLTTVAF